jgi:hypothetical protein
VPMKMFLSASYMGMGYVDAQNSNQAWLGHQKLSKVRSDQDLDKHQGPML